MHGTDPSEKETGITQRPREAGKPAEKRT